MPYFCLSPFYFSYRFQPSALIFTLTFARFFLLAGFFLVKLTSKTFLDISYTAQKVGFLLDNIAMLVQQSQLQITNNSLGLY